MGNRDEFHGRPATALDWWPEAGFWAGRDQRAGGTWLAVAPDGRFATVTNVREAGGAGDGRSRGELPVLAMGSSPRRMAAHVRAHGHEYAGFNLLLGDIDSVVVLSNRLAGPQRLPAGVHALSNAGLNTPWPKVTAVRERLARQLAYRCELHAEGLLALLQDCAVAPEARLPRTGIPLSAERRLSAMFVVSPDYGTRCTTAFLIRGDGRAELRERRFDPLGRAAGEARADFRCGAPGN